MRHFVGEEFLINNPPNYEWKTLLLSGKIMVVVLFCVVAFPSVMRSFLERRSRQRGVAAEAAIPSSDIKTPNRKIDKKLRGKRDKKNKSSTPVTNDDMVKVESARLVAIASKFMHLVNFACLISVVCLLSTSPNNNYAARAVFEAPLFSQEECDEILKMAHKVGERNLVNATKLGSGFEDNSKLLETPKGWRKARHTSYPTTDLNLVTDPFTRENKMYLKEKLDARLSPLIERVYGIVPKAIRANDLFIVRYDASLRASLKRHTDDGDVSFNILLNDEFTGGGTRFWRHLYNEIFADVNPSKGNVLIHNAIVSHEGLPISIGTRYILVGFLSVDSKDPFTGESTGLSWFASWLSIAWLHVKMKDGFRTSTNRVREATSSIKWTDNKYARSLFRDIVRATRFIGDELAPHFHVKLVENDNADSYIAKLDVAHQQMKNETNHDMLSASWFTGQHLNVDIDGSIYGIWHPREDAQETYKDL